MNFQNLILIIILLIFPLGQIIRIQLPLLPSEIKIQPIDIFVLIFSLSWIFKKKKESQFKLFSKEITIFLGIAFFSLLIKTGSLAIKDFTVALLYFLRVANYFLFYFSFSDYLKKHKNLSLNKYLIFEGFAIAIFSITQYLFLPDVRFLYFSGWDDHYFRAIGTFLDPGFNGLLLVLSFFVIVNNFIENEASHPVIPCSTRNLCRFQLKAGMTRLILSGLLILTAIALTFSRTSYLTLALGLLILLVIKKKYKALVLLLALFVVIVIALPKPTGEGVDLLRKSTIFARFDNYRQLALIIKDNFLLGTGFNALRPSLYKYGYLSEVNWETSNAGAGADNSFLFVLATTGIIGLASFLLLLFSIIKRSIRELKKNQFSLLTLVSFITIIAASLFINGFFYPWVMFWMLALLAQFTVESEG